MRGGGGGRCFVSALGPFAGPLRLTARLDADGDASSRSPGDLQGAAEGTHEPGDRGVRVVLDAAL